ncbi:hypothetical protein AFK68_00210, partial [Hydrocoleum sp. CS-953]|uniref:DUF1071 domain-containing protein n=1 Tax=Hydrocoleum sp. CS-953 TaxID=1671698 RepID=UPI000BD0BB12
SKFKEFLRSRKARTQEELNRVISEALAEQVRQLYRSCLLKMMSLVGLNIVVFEGEKRCQEKYPQYFPLVGSRNFGSGWGFGDQTPTVYLLPTYTLH